MKLATKVKLVVNQKEKEQLTQTMIAFNRAANYVSRVAFENKTFGQVNLHKLVYYEIKQKYNLSSQLAIRAIGKVVDVYKNKKQRIGIVNFKEMGSIDYDTRNLSIKKDNVISLATLGKRISIKYKYHKPLKDYDLCCQSELNFDKPTNRFYVSFFYDKTELAPYDTEKFIGVDLGVVNLATTSDGEVFSGEKVEEYRKKITKLKAELQSKKSVSAKYKLKRLSKREANYKKDVNHCISKKLVQKANALKVGIKLEDLNFKKKVKSKGYTKKWKDNNARIGKWAFFQLRSFIDYKAKLLGIPVIYIKPAYTSQTCSKCGHCHEDNRLNQSEFKCLSCDYENNADLNAAINISRASINKPIVDNHKVKSQTQSFRGWVVDHIPFILK